MIELDIITASVITVIGLLGFLWMIIKTGDEDLKFFQVLLMLIFGCSFLFGLSQVLKMTIV